MKRTDGFEDPSQGSIASPDPSQPEVNDDRERTERPGSPDEAGGWLDVLFESVEAVAASVGRLIEVQADRVRLSVQRSMVKTAIGGAAALGAAVWVVAGTLALLRGICGGLAALSGGRAWLGDLAGGALALGSVIAVVALGSQAWSRRELRRLEAKYERKSDERRAAGHGDDEGENGGGAPRPRAGAVGADDRGRGAAAR